MNSFVEESRLRLCLLVPLPHSALRLEVSLPLACRARDFRDQFPRGFHGWARHPPAAGAAQASGIDAHPRRIMKNKLDRMPNPQTLDDRSASAASTETDGQNRCGAAGCCSPCHGGACVACCSAGGIPTIVDPTVVAFGGQGLQPPPPSPSSGGLAHRCP